ncbi:DUF551 domain-containing protein, partial [Shinella sp. JR1-6]|uniref:DUF551 domain-containing protein n=1 Tax=Shinella sp. JR1-6 TaxID=2527671 RepID=UPI001404E7A6
HSLGAGTLAEALMPFISAALSIEQTEPVKVKALEWEDLLSQREDGPAEPTGDIEAATIIGEYSVCLDEDEGVLETPWCAWSPVENIGHFESLEAAKAAAQQDYETRILSALVNAQADAYVVERWQPIDTAPRDGRVVLAYFPLEGLGADWCRVMPVYFSKTMQPRPWIFAGRAASSYGEGPTHWQPLPAPPTTRTADRAEQDGSAISSSGTSPAAIRQRGESDAS